MKLAGAAGSELTVMAIVLCEEVPQLLEAVTISVPDVAVLVKLIVIELPEPLMLPPLPV